MTAAVKSSPHAFVIGGTGFVGRNLLPILLGKGWTVTAMTRRMGEADSRIRWLEVSSVETALKEAEAIAPIDTVFHLAGRVNGSPREIKRDNADVTAAMLAALEDSRSRPKIVYLSSVSAIDRLGLYGDAKRTAEEMIHASGHGFAILRSSLIYGAHEKGNVARLIEAARAWPLIPIPGGHRTKLQPLYVDDLCGAIVSGASVSSNEVYVLSGPRQERLWDMVRMICTRLDRSPTLVAIPLLPLQIAARAISVLPISGSLPIQQISTLHDHPAWVSDKAMRELDFAPRTFAEGIARYISNGATAN